MSLVNKCRTHMKQQGIQTPESLKIHLKQIFKNHQHQDDCIIAIYKMILPEWDNIKQLNGHPVCGQELWLFICELSIKFDQKYHPDCMAGGAWINFGFSSDHETPAWKIDLTECSATYKEAHYVEYPNQRTIEQNTKTI